jgi:hypothetical protein
MIRNGVGSGLFLAAVIGISVFTARSAHAQAPTPGYNSPWRNPDGSVKLALEFGGGIDTAVGPTRHYQERGWNFTMGGGYNFNRQFGVLLEYGFHHAMIPPLLVQSAYEGFAQPPIVGAIRLWSFTAEPVFHYFSTEHFGGYVIGGGGFYRKLTAVDGGSDSFTCTLPTFSTLCSVAPGTRFSNNAGGLNLGTGLAWRVSDRSNVKVYAEARYTWVDNQPSPTNVVYPPANYRTGYIPLTGGLRW